MAYGCLWYTKAMMAYDSYGVDTNRMGVDGNTIIVTMVGYGYGGYADNTIFVTGLSIFSA